MPADVAAIGARISQARRDAGLTQEQLASAVGMPRTSLSKIETAERRVSAVELADIAHELEQRIEWFIDGATPAIASYRSSADGRTLQAIDSVIERLAAYVEFAQAEGGLSPVDALEPLQRPLSTADAESLAMYARDLLDIPLSVPATDLDRRVASLGLLAFSVVVDGGADGATVLLRSGGVAVINGNSHVGRRRLTLAHELGHYLIQDPYTVDWRVDSHAGAEAIEARLDCFARAFLLPEGDLVERWAQWRTVHDLRTACVLAGNHYRVDMATMARRLTEIDAVNELEAAQVRSARTKRADIVEHDLMVPHELAPPSLPAVYQRAVLDLYRREVISSGRAIELLLGTFDEDGLPDLPQLPEGEIWNVTA